MQGLPAMSLLEVTIKTGRTHQIRVHFAHVRHPVVGDTVYGRARAHRLPLEPTRQLLHAEKLSFTHPRSGQRMAFAAPLPADFQALLAALRQPGAQA